MLCSISKRYNFVHHHSLFFYFTFYMSSFACCSYFPSLCSFAASKLIALLMSGEVNMLRILWIISTTFLFGSHYFSPTISWQISPSFTFGCQMGVLNLTTGNLNGNCSGKSRSTISWPPSKGDPIGPTRNTSQWNKFSFCFATTLLALLDGLLCIHAVHKVKFFF